MAHVTTSDMYDGTGAQNDFVITFSYQARSFIEVYVDAVLQTSGGTDYAFLNNTTIRFEAGSIPGVGTDNVEIRRVTSTTPLIDWVAGASITDTDLDTSQLQLLNIVEELHNDFAVTLGKTGGHWDGDSLRITNVAAPIADTDVATKASIAAQVTAAELAETNAETAETNAAASAAAASTSETNAGTSETNAAATAATITSVYPVSGLAAGEMLVATGATSMGAGVRVPHWEYVSNGTFTGANEDIVLSGGYRRYLIMGSQVTGDTSADDLDMRISIDAGSTFKAGTGDYCYLQNRMTSGGQDLAAVSSTGACELIFNPTNELGSDIEMTLDVGDGTLPGWYKTSIVFHDSTRSDAGSITGSGGFNNGAAPHLFPDVWDQLRFEWSGGNNFSAGTYILYGWVA